MSDNNSIVTLGDYIKRLIYDAENVFNEKLTALNNSILSLPEGQLKQKLIEKRNEMIALDFEEWAIQEKGQRCQEIAMLDPTLQFLRAGLKGQVDIIRDSYLFQDVPWEFACDSHIDFVQFRDDRDRQNLQDAVISALGNIAEGDTDIDIPFMTATDNLKIMKPQEMVEMGTYMKNRGENIYGVAWGHKYMLDYLPDFESLMEYDYTVGFEEE